MHITLVNFERIFGGASRETYKIEVGQDGEYRSKAINPKGNAG